MKLGSLFSGYGGLDLAAAEVLGGEVAWHCEWDDAPSKILAHHYPDIPNFRDVSLVDFTTVPPVDVLTGGFPCQDVSLAGRRAGMREGTRSGLWSQYARAIDELKPSLVVIENVRGLLSAEADRNMEPDPWSVGDGDARPSLRALGAVLGDLADLGYDAEWCGVRAADAGAPHGRFRVFVIAYPRGGRDGRRAVASGHGEGAGADVAFDRADPRAHRAPVADSEHVIGYGSGRAWHRRAEPTDGRTFIADARRERFGEHSGEPPAEETRTGSGDLADGARRPRTDTDWGPYRPAIERWERMTGRAAPSPTEADGRNGQHRLSARLVEWMMGLPDGWVTAPEIGLTRNEQLKALGNGVVPAQAALALRTLLGAS